MKMREVLLFLCVGACAGCPDPGLTQMAFCQENLVGPAGGDACSVEYTACEDSFVCSWRVECSSSGGKTTCSCKAAAGCHIDATWETEDVCSAVSASDRGAVRDLVVQKCLGMSPGDVDFSRID